MRNKPATRFVWPLLADLVCVLALAAGGKSSHEADESGWIVLAIAWPFALGTAVAHLGLAARGGTATRPWPEGAIVVVTTYVLGMVLRAASGRGLAPGFLVVSALFLTATMIGWRLVVGLIRRRRAAHAS